MSRSLILNVRAAGRPAKPAMRAVLAVALLAAVLAACGSSKGASPTTQQGAAGGSTTSKWPPSPAGTWGKEPTVVVPKSAPPTTLVSENLINGSGAVAADGDGLTMQYVGATYSTGKVFDASWTDEGAFSFDLGEGQVIKGWDQGIVGMRVGGRRELIIPPALAYGSSGRPPVIAPNSTLIFIVDLLKVQS